MKKLWPYRWYMALGRMIWTAEGMGENHCPFCLAPLPNDVEEEPAA